MQHSLRGALARTALHSSLVSQHVSAFWCDTAAARPALLAVNQGCKNLDY